MAGKGFASMEPEKVSEIASKGGKASQAGGKAHRFTSEEAQNAGRRGGKVSRKRGPNLKRAKKTVA